MAKGFWRAKFESLELGREDTGAGCLTEAEDQGGEVSVREQNGPLACSLYVLVLLGFCHLCKDM